MYEILIVWLFSIIFCNVSLIAIVTMRKRSQPQCKDFTLVDYQPIIKPVSYHHTQQPLTLLAPINQDCKICPLCHQYNIANYNMESVELNYHIPLVAPHKYRGANLYALCQKCVDKLHKQIDDALDGALERPSQYGGNYHHNGKCENLDCEFEILIDGKSVYKGYDYKMIKVVMGKTKQTRDKYVTPWLAIADIKQIGYSRWKINGNIYDLMSQCGIGYATTEIQRVIKGLQAQNKEYVIARSTYTDKKRYIVLEREANELVEVK